MKAYQPKNIKEHNKNLIIQILKDSELPLTKRELSDQAKLSVVTINKLIPELVETQIITEFDSPIETGGRYATAYEFNANYQAILINLFVERHGEKMVDFYVINLLGQIIDQVELTAVTLDKFIQEIIAIKDQHPEIRLSITGIPGVEHDNQLKIIDIESFKHVDLNQVITEAIDVPSYIENDVNAAALGFSTEDTPVVASIYFPEISEVGGALIINQWIFKGHNNLSGELKHLPFIHQRAFPLKKDERQAVIQDAIQSIVALYDPSDILIFIPTTWYTNTLVAQVEQSIAQVFSYDVSVNIHLSHDFSHYYLQGLIKLALSKVELTV